MHYELLSSFAYKNGDLNMSNFDIRLIHVHVQVRKTATYIMFDMNLTHTVSAERWEGQSIY